MKTDVEIGNKEESEKRGNAKKKDEEKKEIERWETTEMAINSKARKIMLCLMLTLLQHLLN